MQSRKLFEDHNGNQLSSATVQFGYGGRHTNRIWKQNFGLHGEHPSGTICAGTDGGLYLMLLRRQGHPTSEHPSSNGQLGHFNGFVMRVLLSSVVTTC